MHTRVNGLKIYGDITSFVYIHTEIHTNTHTHTHTEIQKNTHAGKHTQETHTHTPAHTQTLASWAAIYNAHIATPLGCLTRSCITAIIFARSFSSPIDASKRAATDDRCPC